MPIYKLEVPIDDYYGNKVFFQEFFFEADQCPTRSQVVQYLNDTIKQYTELGEEYLQGIPMLEQSLDSIDKIFTGWVTETFNADCWPVLSGALVQSNCFCITRWGRQPITMKRLQPVKL